MPIGAIIGGAATLGSALIGSSSAKKAANAQVEANREAIAAQERMLERVIGLNEPFRQGGVESLGMLMNGLRDGSLLEGPDPANFRTSPGYEFARSEGLRGIDNRLASMGLRNSGGAIRSATRFATGLADQDYGDWWNRENQTIGNTYNRLANAAGLGQTAVGQVGAATQNAGNNTSNLLSNSGAARASGYAGQSAAWQQGLGSLASLFGGMKF